MKREFSTVEENVHQHDWNEFAGFTEEEGRERDVGEGEETEWSCRGCHESDEGVGSKEGFGGFCWLTKSAVNVSIQLGCCAGRGGKAEQGSQSCGGRGSSDEEEEER